MTLIWTQFISRSFYICCYDLIARLMSYEGYCQWAKDYLNPKMLRIINVIWPLLLIPFSYIKRTSTRFLPRLLFQLQYIKVANSSEDENPSILTDIYISSIQMPQNIIYLHLIGHYLYQFPSVTCFLPISFIDDQTIIMHFSWNAWSKPTER